MLIFSSFLAFFVSVLFVYQSTYQSINHGRTPPEILTVLDAILDLFFKKFFSHLNLVMNE